MNNLAEQDITVKKISTDIVYRLDQQASERGESRNQYIKEILENVCVNPIEADRLDREEKMFENVATIIEINIDTLKKTAQTLKEAMDYFDDEEDEEDE